MFEYDVLIATYNRGELLKNCLESFPTDPPEGLKKVIFITLANDQDTELAIKETMKPYDTEIIKVNEILKPGASRNIMIEKSSADYLAFLDDDILIPEDYFQKCLKIVKENQFDIFGGPDNSPQNDSLRQKIIGDILAHPFAMGPTSARHACRGNNPVVADETKLTLCNMWMKREILMDSHLRFSENLRRCEENQLLEELSSLGYIMHYVPDMFIYHHRRESLLAMARIQYLSGYYRSVCFYLNHSTFKFFFLAPILTGLLLTIFIFLPNSLKILLIGIHTTLAWTVCYNIFKKYNSLFAFFWGWITMVTIHIFFSLGMFMGILMGWKNAKLD